MKIRTLYSVIILLNSMTFCYSQDTINMRQIKGLYEVGVPEKYDFEETKGGTKDLIYICDDWLIEVWKKKEAELGICKEYSPASDFYKIMKFYHPNGMIKERGKTMCGIEFDKWEYFDEKGKLVKVDDEDAKYKNVKIKREDVLAILEKDSVFNRKTGEHSIIDKRTVRGRDLTNPLKIDGSFYRTLEYYISFQFDPPEISEGKEIKPPTWLVGVERYPESIKRTTTVYKINGHTGEYNKRDTDLLYER